ncbi:MAG: 3'-5' exonuclease, partial [Candidatus Promineifilaceae bacterium]
GYLDDGTEVGRDRWANVMELRSMAIEKEELDLGQFLEQVALISDVDNYDENADVATLLTLHSAKGLEFPIVFIVGLVDGTLPHNRSLADGEELAEERRLFYVGLTRAKDRVFLSYSFRKNAYGGSEPAVPSRFLRDIPLELIEGGSSAKRRRKTISKAASWDWSKKSWSNLTADKTAEGKRLPEPYSSKPAERQAQPARLTEPKYRTGQNVYHNKFGEGVVIDSRITGSDEEVDVAFTEHGLKKLAASIAKLEIKD